MTENVNYISLKVSDELYALLRHESERRGLPLIDIAVQLVAKGLKRPDLGHVPRKNPGRPAHKPLVESK